jgi:hypothetical protein
MKTKPLDDLVKEDLDTGIRILKKEMFLQHNYFDYDKKEIEKYVIKRLKEK